MKLVSKKNSLKKIAAIAMMSLIAITSAQAFKQHSYSTSSTDLSQAKKIDVDKMLDTYIEPFRRGYQVTGTLAAVDKQGVAHLAQVNLFEKGGKIGFYLNHDTDLGAELLHGQATAFIVSDDAKYAVEVTGGVQINMSRRVKGHEQHSLDPAIITFYKHLASDGAQERVEKTVTQWHSGHWLLISKTTNDCLGPKCIV